MQTQANATDGRTGGGSVDAREQSLLVNVLDVAAMMQCSPRHVYRLCDAQRMPRPYKIGALCRWDRAAIQLWVGNGCPNCRTGGAK